MPTPRRDHQLEQLIGKILRLGVIVSSLITLVGGVLYLMSNPTRTDYHVFRGEPIFLRQVSDIVTDAAAFDPRGIIQLGIVLLLATPILRVALSAVSFAILRDTLYVVVTVAVLSVLLFSLLGPHLPSS
jgi:uncharacterized membrane protein